MGKKVMLLVKDSTPRASSTEILSGPDIGTFCGDSMCMCMCDRI